MFRYCEGLPLLYSRTHFESMLRDPEEVFRFVWENRDVLRVSTGVFSEVESVRPCRRVGPDGFILHETVAELVQQVRLEAGELKDFGGGIPKPEWMPDDHEVRLFGGGTLIFDEYGRLKYHIYNHVCGSSQNARLQYLLEAGFFAGKSLQTRFSSLHRLRSIAQIGRPEEGW